MYPVYHLSFDANGNIVYLELLDTGDHFTHDIVDPNEVELMQFTGLHDASGREIYEGDILGMDDPTDTSRAVVVFHEGAFKPQLCVQWDSPIFDNDWDDWEVIGNRWEHPELMQKDGEV